MNWWRVLRITFFLVMLGLSIIPATRIATLAVQGILAGLGANGLLLEERIYEQELKFDQEKTLRELDEKSRQLLHERDLQILRKLEELLEPEVPAGEV